MQRIRLILLGLITLLIVSACGGQAVPPTVTLPPPTEPPPAPTEESAEPTAEPAEAESSSETEADSQAEAVESTAECVALDIPTNPNIPAVTADEWQKGPADAQVTLIEYGDFQ